jgi:hypothetical protein
MSDTTPVLDGEVVAPNTAAAATVDANDVNPPGSFDPNAYNATIEVVRRRLTILEKAKEELKKHKEMYDDALGNNPTYAAIEKEVKDVTQKKKDATAQLSKQPALIETMSQIKNLREDIKSNEVSLADELMEYYKTAGVMEIEDSEGNVQEFVISIKLKPKIKINE